MKAAILGYGTVGSGVAEVLTANSELICRNAHETVEIKYILDLRDFPGDVHEDKIIHDFETIVNDPEIGIVCETMGGDNPAYTFTKRCLEAGKSVCTSNKEVVANHGPELIQIARENNCGYYFEASVGGGIPIIRVINDCLTTDRILSLAGILNGTTNYILTKMAKEGADFEAVLKQAQELGYAEKNPEADVEGHDACRKIAILASLVTGKNVDFKSLNCTGITKISSRDFMYAKKLGRSIKLLATADFSKDGLIAGVSPYMLPAEHPLNGIDGVFNAVFVHSEMLDDTMYYGRGAGKLPTATAVVSDVVCATKLAKCPESINWEADDAKLADFGQVERQFFVRVKESDGSESNVKAFFGDVDHLVIDGVNDEFGFVTSKMTEAKFEELRAKMPGILNFVRLDG